MDETIADTLKEHIRRYNAEFAEKIIADDLYGKHLDEFAPLDRSEVVRRMIRDESFFDCLDVIEEAQQVIGELVREHEVFIVSAVSYGKPGVIRSKAPLATEAFPVYFHEERRFLRRQRNHRCRLLDR